jgi:histidine triad (HIT) family protein
MKTDANCIFCKIVAGQIPSIKLYEDESAFCFMDINPVSKGHLLVIPKEHYDNVFEIPPEAYGSLYATAAKLASAIKAEIDPDGLTILQLNGKAAGQVVPHVHIHLMPRRTGDGLKVSEWEMVPGNKDEIAALAERLKTKMG